MQETDRSTKVHIGFALSVIVVMVGASWNLSSKLSDIREEVGGVRLELANEYARKDELKQVSDAIHKVQVGQAVIADRLQRIQESAKRE